MPAHETSSVLVIHSYHSDFSWTARLTEGLNDSFAAAEVEVFYEYLDAKRYPQLEHGQEFLDYLNHKYTDTGIDVMMVSDDPGLELVLANRPQLLPDVPIVFLGINHVNSKLLNLPGVTGVFETHSVTETAAEILRQNNTNSLIVVNDTSHTGQANMARIDELQEIPEAPENIVILEDVEINQIRARFREYPTDWPIFITGQLRQDGPAGSLVALTDGAAALRSRLPNPIYSHTEAQLGHGIVGGKLLNGAHHAQQAAELVQRILNGESVDDIAPIQESETLWMFDVRELERFDIDLASLPQGSKLLYQKQSFYERYKSLVWMTMAAFSASLLIILLLVEVLRRRSVAAQILSENEQRYRDLAAAGANLFWEIDPQLCFSYVSGKLPFYKAVEPAALLGKSLKAVVTEAPQIDFDFDAFQSLIETCQPIDGFVFRFKETDKTVRILSLSGCSMTDPHGEFSGYRGILREITAEYQLSETIAYQATYDSLTGLINRNEFDQRLKESVMRSQRHGTRSVLCYLDLDQFKIVNDTVGHLVGDQLLAELAHLLGQGIRPSDSLGRLGGDEFGLILGNTSIEEGRQICEALIQKVRNYRFTRQERQFNVGISIGMVPILPTTLNPIEVLSRADLACYKAKDLGRNRIYVADVNDAELDMRQSQMARVANISQALEANRFFLVQQPIQSLNCTEEQPHVEILLRLYDEEGQVISPGKFIPVAEGYGLISLIDRWVVETIVKNYNTLFKDQKTLVSINLSGVSLSDDRFIDFVENLMRQSHIDPHYICFEITETAAISHLDQVKVFIQAMKEMGVKFALDDFGSGVSSFGYLRSLPVDYLKIDGQLVRNIVHERCDRAIVDLVNQVAHMMNMRTIAEFVEDDKIIEQLQLLEVDYAQGYALGKITELEEVWTEHSQVLTDSF
ncbi:MAG: EAL domain-containing protein [Cyanobacteria bacterium P01_F01_bin.86]